MILDMKRGREKEKKKNVKQKKGNEEEKNKNRPTPRLPGVGLRKVLHVQGLGLCLSGVKTGILCLCAEILLLETELGEQLRVRLCDGADLEETVHGLERQALCLRDEEVDEDDGAHHERGEEKVDSVSHGVEHLWGEAGDDEVPEPEGAKELVYTREMQVKGEMRGYEPVVGGSASLAERTGLHVEHLGVENPRSAVPRRGVEDGPEIEEDNGCSTF